MNTSRIPLSLIVEPKDNPNSMSSAAFSLLQRSMLKIGDVQPVLVRPVDGGKFELVDGVHRTRAVTALLEGDSVLDAMSDDDDDKLNTIRCQLEAFRESHLDSAMDCVIARLSDEEAKAVQIGMNRLRGELNLGDVARTLADLTVAGWSISDVGITGFDDREAEALIKSVLDAHDEVDPSMTELGSDEPPAEKKVKPFVLELTFATKDELSRARRGLKKAAGKGELSQGLINLLDGV